MGLFSRSSKNHHSRRVKYRYDSRHDVEGEDESACSCACSCENSVHPNMGYQGVIPIRGSGLLGSITPQDYLVATAHIPCYATGASVQADAFGNVAIVWCS